MFNKDLPMYAENHLDQSKAADNFWSTLFKNVKDDLCCTAASAAEVS